MSANTRLWEFRWVRDLFALAALVGVLWLGYALSIVTIPLLVALGAAYLVDPVITWMARQSPRLGRKGALALLMAVVGAAGIGLLLWIVPTTYRQACRLSAEIPAGAAHLSTWLTDAKRPAWVREHSEALVPVLEKLAGRATAGEVEISMPAQLPEFLPEITSRALQTLMQVIGWLASFGIFIALFFFSFIAFVTGWQGVIERGRAMIPEPVRPRVVQLIGRMDAVIAAFVRGRLGISAILAVIYMVGWSLCGVPHALVIGLITGLCTIIPYLAAIGLPMAWISVAMAAQSGLLPADSWYLSQGADGMAQIAWLKVLIIPALVNTTAQCLEDYVLNPIIQGKATALHPVAIMAAIIAGGSLAGLYGMLLAVPIVASLRILGEEVFLPRLRGWLEASFAPTKPPP